MNDKFDYLSDEELEKLINDTEASGLLQAPLGFEKGILDRIDEVTDSPDEKIISFDEKKMSLCSPNSLSKSIPLIWSGRNNFLIRKKVRIIRSMQKTTLLII